MLRPGASVDARIHVDEVPVALGARLHPELHDTDERPETLSGAASSAELVTLMAYLPLALSVETVVGAVEDAGGEAPRVLPCVFVRVHAPVPLSKLSAKSVRRVVKREVKGAAMALPARSFTPFTCTS
jgi:hypothetical protein